jgi:hypothetical protein
MMPSLSHDASSPGRHRTARVAGRGITPDGHSKYDMHMLPRRPLCLCVGLIAILSLFVFGACKVERSHDIESETTGPGTSSAVETAPAPSETPVATVAADTNATESLPASSGEASEEEPKDLSASVVRTETPVTSVPMTPPVTSPAWVSNERYEGVIAYKWLRKVRPGVLDRLAASHTPVTREDEGDETDSMPYVLVEFGSASRFDLLRQVVAALNTVPNTYIAFMGASNQYDEAIMIGDGLAEGQITARLSEVAEAIRSIDPDDLDGMETPLMRVDKIIHSHPRSPHDQ